MVLKSTLALKVVQRSIVALDNKEVQLQAELP